MKLIGVFGLLVISFALLNGCTNDVPEPDQGDKNVAPISTKDIQTFSGKLLKIDLENDAVVSPDVSTDKVVFNSYGDSGNVDIYMYDIPTGKIERITYDNSVQTYPKLINNEVYWLDSRTVPSETIWKYDLIENKETKTNLNPIEFMEDRSRSCYENQCVLVKEISTKESFKEGPDERGMYDIVERVVSIDDYLFLYDKLTNTTTLVTNDSHPYYKKKEPSIWKNRIVWSDNRNGETNFDIYMYDLETKKETQITNTPESSEKNPIIYGDYIAYLRYQVTKGSIYGSSGDYDLSVYYYDLNKNQEVLVFDKDNGDKNSFKIFGRNIVWSTCEDDLCRDMIIYLYII